MSAELTTLVPAEICVVCGSSEMTTRGTDLHCGGCMRRVVHVQRSSLRSVRDRQNRHALQAWLASGAAVCRER